MRNLPPYVDGAWPIIGHSVMLLTAKNWYSVLEQKTKLLLDQKIASRTLRVGVWNFHVIMNPDDAYQASSCLVKDTLYDYFKPALGEGLLTANVLKWKRQRKILNPAFNQQVLDGFINEFNNQTRQLMDDIAACAGKEPFDQYKYLTQSVLETVCATSIGTSIDDKRDRQMFMKWIQKYLFHMIQLITKFWLHSDLISSLTGHKKQLGLLANKLKTVTKAILKRKRAEYQMQKQQIDNKTGTRFKSFIEIILELSENGEHDEQEIIDELNTFIVAGSDTISVALSNTLTCIGSYAAVQDRVLEELQEVFRGSDRDVEKHDLPKLKYLEAVIKETLRLYPTIPLVGRLLETPLQIEGYTLPAGSRVITLIYGLGRHWTWGPDADTFRPERWLDGSLPSNLKAWAVFALGKRNCIGSTFAIMCMKIFLAGILRRYSIKSDINKMVQEWCITTKPISGHEISIDNRYKFTQT